MNKHLESWLKMEIEELLYNENRTPDQPPWFLVRENDSTAEHWGKIADKIVARIVHLSENVCPECGEYRLGDERVKNGMKCGECAY